MNFIHSREVDKYAVVCDRVSPVSHSFEQRWGWGLTKGLGGSSVERVKVKGDLGIHLLSIGGPSNLVVNRSQIDDILRDMASSDCTVICLISPSAGLLSLGVYLLDTLLWATNDLPQGSSPGLL